MRADLKYLKKFTTLPPKAGSKRGRRVLEEPQPQSPSTLKKTRYFESFRSLAF